MTPTPTDEANMNQTDKYPNIQKLEDAFNAISRGHCNISVQPSCVETTLSLWTVSFTKAGSFHVGQGSTLSEAIQSIKAVMVAAPALPDVAQIEQVAA